MNAVHKRIVSIVLLIATLLSIVSVGALSVSAASASVVTTDAVRLRRSPEIVSDNVITTLDEKEELTLLSDSKDGWANVKRLDGTTGYCSVDYLQVPSGSGVKLTGITNDAVNFRKGPSTDYDSMGLLDKDTAFTVVDNSEELWVKVTVNSTTGYIYRIYTELTLTMPSADAPFNPSDPPETPDWFDSSALEDMLGGGYTADDNVPLSQSIALSDTSVSVEEGSTYTLIAYVTGGTSAQNAVIFTTSDKNIVTVTNGGTVKGVSVGTATITATMNGSDKSATCKVTVTESTTQPPEDALVLNATSVTMASGNHYQLTANLPKVTWKSSDTSIATVSGGIITAKSAGEVTITASTATQSAKCTVRVTSAPSGITIYSSTATVAVGRTYYNGIESSSKATWSSSDTSVATVSNGFITAVSEGKAVITATNSSGTKTCLVSVVAAEPIRFAYSQPNTAAPGEKITLCAVTDKNRTAVKFEVNVGGKITTVNATDKTSDGNTYIWTGTTTISTSGTYDVVAYAKQSGGDFKTCSDSCSDAKTTVFVRKTADKKAETTETRRATDELITLLSEFEGYSPCVYFDTIANNIPTLGYGKVVYIGDSFYNDMTKNEAYAYLVQTVNNDGYTSSVNKYLDGLKVSRNQQQFDALVSFVYNLGAYILSGDSDFKDIFLATGKAEDTSASDTDAYISGNDVNFRAEPSISSEILACLAYGTKLTLIEKEASDNWYHVKTENGTEGYVHADYVKKGKLSASSDYSLGRVDKKAFTKLMLQYHHAGPTCVWGLLYRRIDELDVFYYGEYARNGSNNKYGYSFTCSVNSSTVI